jgi:hypothetical protein
MNAYPRDTQVPVGPLVAALGALLLIVSLFMDWYQEVSGFTIFEFNDLLLLALALLTLAALAAAMGFLRAGLTPGHSVVIAVLALLVVFSQIVNDPPQVAAAGGVEKDTGIWLALAGAALMVAGAVLSSVKLAIAVEPRERRAEQAPREQPPRDRPAPASEAPTVSERPPPRP